MAKKFDTFNQIHSLRREIEEKAAADETEFADAVTELQKAAVLDAMEDEALGKVKMYSDVLEKGGYTSTGLKKKADAARLAVASGIAIELLKRDEDGVYWLPGTVH